MSEKKAPTPKTPEAKKPKFALGQRVNVLRDNGVVENDWRVAQYAINGTSVVVMKRNEKGKQLSKTISEKELLGWQTPTPKAETNVPEREIRAEEIEAQFSEIKEGIDKLKKTAKETGWAFADEEVVPKTGKEADEKIENERARNAYFESLKNKKPKKGTLEFDVHETDLETKEKDYKVAKNKIVKGFLAEGEPGKIKAQEFLLGEVELKRKNDLENGPLLAKIKTKVSKGIAYWEGIGNNPDDSKKVRRLKQIGKTMAAVAIIGGTSAGIVSALSTAGIGTAAAVSGTYFGRKIAMSVGFSTAVSVLPDSMKPFASKLALGLAATSAAGALGYGASKLSGLATKKWWSEKAIAEKTKEEMGKLGINLETLEADLTKYEQECEKIIKEAESKRTYRRLLAGTVALVVSVGFLETAGHKVETHNAQVEKTQLGVHPKPHATDLEHGNGAKIPLTDTKTIAAPTGTPAGNNFHAESITFEHGHGAIQGILELKTQMREHYHNDFSHAPKSVQDFMAETNVTKQATQLGFYDPRHVAESAMIMKGSTLGFDEHGNLTFHDAGGRENILIHGNNPTIEKYHGKMFDSDHSANHETAVVHPNLTPETQASAVPIPGHHDVLQTLAPEHAPTTTNIPPAETKPQIGEAGYTYGPPNYTYGTGSPHVNRNFYGPGAEHGNHFPDLSPEQNNWLNHHPEFANNPFNLTGKELIETYNAREQNIDHFWGHDIWESFKGHKASTAMKHTILTDGVTETGKLGNYLILLKTSSGLEPHHASVFHWKSETVAEFSARALQKIEADGRMENFQGIINMEPGI